MNNFTEISISAARKIVDKDPVDILIESIEAGAGRPEDRNREAIKIMRLRKQMRRLRKQYERLG